MSGISKKLMGTTAAGGGFTAIEDVFSTYLYTGNGSTQTITNGIALGDFGVGTSTEFDGLSDYLSRSTDLTGAVDSKTFTFSMWVYRTHPDGESSGKIVELTDSIRFYFQSTYFYVLGSNSSGSTAVFLRCNENLFPLQAWSHVVVSVDTATSSASIYVNDVLATLVTNTINNLTVDFTRTATTYWAVGCQLNTSATPVSFFNGRLAHVYLDYTYRDLSVEANRRLFIDANGGSTSPTTLSALSPILYLPMTDAYAVGESAGTGGNFTPNGSPTIIQSGTQFVEGYGEGGLVWAKGRSGATDHQLFDTLRGATKELISNSTAAEATDADTLTAFNAGGFSLGADANVNTNAATYASWTFRKAPRFFDVVTYTGDGTADRPIVHSLTSVPGAIFVKATSTTSDWFAVTGYNETSYFLGDDNTNATPYALNTTGGVQIGVLKSVIANENTFNAAKIVDTISGAGFNATKTNAAGVQYVAYLFAHDPLGPSGDGSDGLIACGSVAGGATVDLGWEPQWVLTKSTDDVGSWWLMDSMRGMPVGGNEVRLQAETSADESALSSYNYIDITSTGFTMKFPVANHIYIAIRRGPMRAPESGTEVFAIDGENDTAPNPPTYNSGFPVDLSLMRRNVSGTESWYAYDRLRGSGPALQTNSTAAELTAGGSYNSFDSNTGLGTYTGTVYPNAFAWMFRRAPEFFDVVAYTGTGADLTLPHNLTVAPELIIAKVRNTGSSWGVATSNDWSKFLLLNSTNAQATASLFGTPDATNFYPTASGGFSGSGNTYIAYLFATLAGISKVGSYTGNGSSQTINCGFTSSARFIIIKRTDSTGDWYVWDTARGIVAANDPHLSLNTTAAEVTTDDSIDPDSSGFIVNQVAATNINVSAASYIFYAVA